MIAMLGSNSWMMLVLLILVKTSQVFVPLGMNACSLKVGTISTYLAPSHFTHLSFVIFISRLLIKSLGVYTCKAPCGLGHIRNYWYGDCQYVGGVITSPYDITIAPTIAPTSDDCLGSFCGGKM